MYGETFSPAIGPTYYSRVTSPYRKPYKTKDGYIGVMIYNDKHWKNFFEVSGRKELAADERFSDMASRTKHIDFVYRTVEEIMVEKTTKEWLEILEGADLPCTNINTPEELFEDPHLKAIGFFEQVEHPTEGQIRDMKFPVSFSETPVTVERYAPNLGEHGKEILEELQLPVKEK